MTAAVVSGTVTINGYVSGSISTSGTSTSDSRAATAKAINAITAKTGVVAIDTGLDSQGLRLEAADGRNIEVAFNTVGTAASFGSSTGLKEGVQTATYSLANSAERKIDIICFLAPKLLLPPLVAFFSLTALPYLIPNLASESL